MKNYNNISIDNKQKYTGTKIDNIYKWMENIMDKFDNMSPNKVETKNSQYCATEYRSNRNFPPLKGGHYNKIGVTWTLKHNISSPKFYEILVKTDLKGDTGVYINIFYNYIKMYLNAVTIIQEDPIPA